MEARRITITSAALARGALNVRRCGREFFPESTFCRPDETGTSIQLHAVGIREPIDTDLPTDRSGRPRWTFRSRRWFREFAARHDLTAGDEIQITRLSNTQYRVSPDFRDIRFVDLFAGIGGMRLAFEAAGARCVFSCEWDRFSCMTYEANFGDRPAGNIRTIPVAEIPDHEVLVAGFPCQPFSIAGVSKKNALGQSHGFRCETQGTLFFDVASIIEHKQPAAFLLENVKNLQRHDKGRTFEIMRRTLEQELGYHVTVQVLDGQTVVPQHRERVFIFGSKRGLEFRFPQPHELEVYRLYSTLDELFQRRVPARYTLTDHLWDYLQRYAEKHRRAGNGFGFGLVGPGDIARTLSARYYKDGSEILIRQPRKNPRRLTPRECARLMGFPDGFEIVVSDTQAYRQFGNSVVVPLVQAIAERVVNGLRSRDLRLGTQSQATAATTRQTADGGLCGS